MQDSGASRATLVRAVGFKGLSASLFNTILGAGIFVLPATVAGIVGTGAPVAYLFCAVAILFVMLAYAAAGSRVVEPGGSYAYIQAAFGPLAGFLGGVMVWLSDTLASGSVAAAFSAAVAVYVPAAGGLAGKTAVLILVVGGLAAINIRGVTKGATFVELITILKIAPLLIFIGVGLALRWRDIPAPTLPSVVTLGRAAIFLMFAYSGAETSMALSGEVKEPHRTIPRALMLSLAVITLLYGSVHAVAAAALGPLLPTSTAAPLADAAGILGGTALHSLVLVGTAVSMLGYLSGIVLATPRTVFGIGRVGVLPSALGRIHPRYRTPHVAILTQAAITICLAATGTFTILVPLATVAVLVLYFSVSLSAWWLARTGVRADGEPFNVPTPVFFVAAAVCVALLFSTTLRELLVEVAVLVTATALFLLRTRGRDAAAVVAAINQGSARN